MRRCWPRWRHRWARDTHIGLIYRITKTCQRCGLVESWVGEPGTVIPRRFL
jgi:hypothetical protein